jgi:Putative zinc-finger
MPVHDEFLELCAVSLSGDLTDDERKKLDEHLIGCASCRVVFDQYQQTATTILPRLASELPLPMESAESSWSEAGAEAAFFERLKAEDRRAQFENPLSPNKNGERRSTLGFVPSPSRWGQFGMLYAAGILLFASLAICAYRIGEKRGIETAATGTPARGQTLEIAKSELSDAGHDRQTLLTEIAARDQVITELKQRIARESAAQDPERGKRETAAVGVGSSKNGSASTARIEQLQRQVDAQEREKAEEVARAGTLEANVADLTKQLQDRREEMAQQGSGLRERDDLLVEDKTIARQQELLAHDRDIRDLMSARDLYIAEVYDVEKTGETNKPYGRVFYTKGKSLLFYAYDLDQQVGLKTASTFQAWGQRVTSHNQALSLGILFEDSVANKRWVVRSEDTKTLEQIDAVFVTVEPKGGSQQPSGKPLLFAYLRIHPNHP